MSAVEEKVITGSLKLISGPNEGLSFDMYGSEMLLGRNSSAPLCLTHRSVSRNHCIFRYTSEGWSVRDNKSQNGTFVNECKIGAEEFHSIKDGDCIYLGNPVIPERLALQFQKHENLSEQQKIATNSPGETDDLDQVSQNNDFNLPQRNSLKRKSDENELQQNKKSCSGAEEINANSRNMPSTFAASLLSPTKKSPHKDTLSNGLNNQKKKASTQKFMEFLNELKTKSPEKREVVEMHDEIIIDSSVSLIGAECEITDVDYSYSPSEDVYLDDGTFDTPVKKEHNSDFSQELPNVQQLRDKISCLETDLEKVKRELLEKNELLKAQAQKQEELEKSIQSHFASAKDEAFKEIKGKLEEELMCNICTEFLLKATVLGCAHTYCEHCIREWKKKKRQCPICREPISVEYKVLLIDSLIDKLADSYDPSVAEKRKELLKARTEKKKKVVMKKKKKNTRQSLRTRLQSSHSITESTSTGGSANSELNALSLLEERVDNILRDTLLDAPVLPEIPEVMILSDFSDLSDSDESVNGYGYYGGYGRCFNCGRRGHWANGCPEF